MYDWVIDATKEAVGAMNDHAALVELPNTDEATFRAFFMAALKRQCRNAQLETEWRRFDLLVRLDGLITLVELKYLVERPQRDIDGRHTGWKGGAGVQNVREFNDCRLKLRQCAFAPVDSRYLIVVYQRKTHQKNDYHASYGGLCIDEYVEEVNSFSIDPFECKILRVRSTENSESASLSQV
jgi:hypothetical protein